MAAAAQGIRSETGKGAADLPNPAPRPEGELARLEAVWQPPRGWRILSAVNNTIIGLFYLGTALLFFLLAGVLALLMRMQLAVPENDLLGPALYNQIFTMHGTTMMFLFAVPAVEAVAIYLLPNMLGARDLPFPRLGAYSFWAYFFGGLAFFASLFFGAAPDGGWFMYPPLTSQRYSPGVNADFWLLGIGFIEISAIAGAVEIIVGVLRMRPPGMTLDRLPVYAWAMLVFGVMIVFAFPSIILGTLLLEFERAFGWPFFDAEQGGDPLLWQHLFWFFGHPEVYIIFLPAAGMVSMIVPAMAGTPLVAYRLVVLALIGTGVLSFGLWVHHMFTTGLPAVSLGFFSAASMAVAVPSGIQVFAWIATFAAGRARPATPTLFLFGFLFIFTLGGLTGVMLAMVPFDWQAHDTYFVVAHFHYVLIGGMVFPLFAAIYYWMPMAGRRPLSERLGRWVFGLLFAGVNLTFLPMHLTGLLGMPRRVYTYPADLGWDGLNLASTAGGFLIAAGVAVFLVDLARNFRPTFEENAGNLWNAGTLEWLPTGTYGIRSVPAVGSREPLWDRPSLAAEVEAGRHYLPGTATGARETLVTTAVDARPDYLLLIPGPGWAPFLAALFTALFFLLLTVKLVALAATAGLLALAGILWWLWESEPAPPPPVAIGGGIVLPVNVCGPRSHAWWATVVLILVAGCTFASLLFSYLFLWTVSADWPPRGTDLPGLGWPAAAAALLAASSAVVHGAKRRLDAGGGAGWAMRLALAAALPLFAGAVAVDLAGQARTGLSPTASAYGAVVYAILALQGFYVALLAVMALFVVARSLAGRLRRDRRTSFDSMMLLWHYGVAQGLVGLAVTHVLPRLLV